MKRRSKLVGPAKSTSIASATAGPKRPKGSIMCCHDGVLPAHGFDRAPDRRK